MNNYKDKKQIGQDENYVDGKSIPGSIIADTENKPKQQNGLEYNNPIWDTDLSEKPSGYRIFFPGIMIRKQNQICRVAIKDI